MKNKCWHLAIRDFTKHQLIRMIEIIVFKLRLSDKTLDEFVKYSLGEEDVLM